MQLFVSFYVWRLLLLVVAAAVVINGAAETDGDDLDELPNHTDIPVVESDEGIMAIVEEEDVMVLTSKNFHHVLATRDLVLVEFYAPWCGHCKSLAPEYAKAAQILKADGIHIAKVDATAEASIGQEFGVTGYPTIKLFRDGKPVDDYDGGRDAHSLVEYMKKMSDPDYKPPPSAVVELTSQNFHDTVDSAELILVKFYTPSCPHCKRLAPEYESAAQELQGYGVPLAKVDATTDGELAEEYNVTGYPTLKIFRKSRVFEYKGDRSVAGIVQNMKDQQRIPSQEVRTLINARNAVLQKQPTAFACLNSAEDPIHEEYIAAANRMRGELAFVHTFDPEIAAAYGVARNSIAVVMPETYKSKHEDSVRTMKQSDVTDDASIVSWLTVNSVPLLGERNKQNQEFLYTGRPLLVIYGEVDFSHQHIGATQHLREKLLPIALKYKDKLTVALSNEEAYSDEIDSLGLGDTGEDVNAAIFTSNQKFVMEPSEDYLEAIEEFINEWHAGELKPFLRSQPVPARQAGPVTVLVAASFEKMVIKSDKDYLIEFYAPWCGHCKKLEPVFKQLANQLSSSAPHVVVAKFDATSNDVPVNFDVAGFPTIYYVRATDRNNPVKFDGDRTVQGFKAFVLEQRQSDGGKEEL